jgi:hypothetical protein
LLPFIVPNTSKPTVTTLCYCINLQNIMPGPDKHLYFSFPNMA